MKKNNEQQLAALEAGLKAVYDKVDPRTGMINLTWDQFINFSELSEKRAELINQRVYVPKPSKKVPIAIMPVMWVTK
jgi:hypothetical protein